MERLFCTVYYIEESTALHKFVDFIGKVFFCVLTIDGKKIKKVFHVNGIIYGENCQANSSTMW